MEFAIYGIGGFGREVAEAVGHASRNNLLDGAKLCSPMPVVFVDDALDKPDRVDGLPVLSFDELRQQSDRMILVAVGDGALRKKIELKCLAAGLKLGNFVASTAKSPSNVVFGAGTILCDYAMITADATIGASFQSNIYSYVAHDCVIGDYVTFAPRVSCNGNVHIGNLAYIGTGALIIQGTKAAPLTIGEGAVVGMGAIVTKPVEPYTLVVGNPARAIKTLKKACE